MGSKVLTKPLLLHFADYGVVEVLFEHICVDLLPLNSIQIGRKLTVDLANTAFYLFCGTLHKNTCQQENILKDKYDI